MHAVHGRMDIEFEKGIEPLTSLRLGTIAKANNPAIPFIAAYGNRTTPYWESIRKGFARLFITMNDIWLVYL